MAIAAEKSLGRLPSFALLVVIFVAAVGPGVYLLHAGISSGWLVAVANVAAVVLTILSEYLLPHVNWRPSWRELGKDVLTMGFNNVIVRPITRAVVMATIVTGITALNTRGVLPNRPDLSSAPLIVQILVPMLLADLGFYVVHRTEHSLDSLWRYHSIHHASTTLYWLKGVRLHFVETVYLGVMFILAGAAVRVSPLATLIEGLTLSTMSMLHHSNIAFKLDWLSYIIMTPEIHRVHHSADAREGRTNYGLVFSIWDRMFRTFHVTTPKELGLGLTEGVPQTFVEDFLYPFRRRPQVTNQEAPAGRVAAGD